MLLGPALPVPETLCLGEKKISDRTRDYFMMNRLYIPHIYQHLHRIRQGLGLGLG